MTYSIAEAIQATQDYLRSGKSLEDMKNDIGVRGKSDGNHIILDYDQIKADWRSPIPWVCRGLVLDAKTFDVLGFPFRKFWNGGQVQADPIDWTTARVVEKLDGSMFSRWYSPHTKKFEYTTRFQLPGDMERNKVNDFGLNWKELLDQAFENSFTKAHSIFEDRNLTIILEVMSFHNRICVKHIRPNAAILAIRNIRTFEEQSIPEELPQPKTFSFSSEKEVKEYADTLDGTVSEGCVVLDANYNRIKVKGQNYEYLHKLKDSAQSVRALILLVRNGQRKQITDNFPEYLPIFERIENIVLKFIERHVAAYQKHCDIEEQKEFAISIQEEKLEATGLLFLLRAGRAQSIESALMGFEPSRYVKLMKPLVEAAGLAVEDEDAGEKNSI